MEPQPGLTVAIALAAGVLAQSISKQARLPGIVLLLAVGATLGPEGLGWVQPRSLGDGLFILVELGVAVILFEGGLNLEWSRLRREEAVIRRLISVAAVVTLVGATLAVRVALGWSWDLAALFGSLVVVTGPTVVTPLLRDMRLKPRLRTVLEAEGVFIDAVGALLATLVLQIVLLPEAPAIAGELRHVASSLGFGLVAGLVTGGVLAYLLRTGLFVAHRYETVFTLAFVILLFEASNAVWEQSGILAVIVAGIVVGNMDTPVDRDLKDFKDRLTVLLVGLLFVLLAADVALDDVWALGWPGLAVVAILAFVIRPVAVWLATWGGDLTPRERAVRRPGGPARHHRGRHRIAHGDRAGRPGHERRSGAAGHGVSDDRGHGRDRRRAGSAGRLPARAASTQARPRRHPRGAGPRPGAGRRAATGRTVGRLPRRRPRGTAARRRKPTSRSSSATRSRSARCCARRSIRLERSSASRRTNT